MRIQLLLIEQLKDLSKIAPDYSFGQLLYTILRKKYMKNRNEKINPTGWLREIDDKEFYTSLEKALKNIENE